MVLAGGALATTACGGSTAAQADAASSATANPGGDATAPGDDGGVVYCCANANVDPCLGNGVFEAQTDGSFGCTPFGPPVDAGAGPTDAAPADAGPTDASDDAPSFLFCCNANPDPCCPIAYCSAGLGPDAAIYVTCEQKRTQCESMNGYYASQPDGSLGCTPTSATGH
jgi:hypothetical protein